MSTLPKPGCRKASFDVEQSWASIKQGVAKNLATPPGGKAMDMKEYMAHYTAIHLFCLQQKAVKGSTMFSSHENRGGAHLMGEDLRLHGRAHLLGEDLYTRLRDFLVEHLQDVRKRLDDDNGDALLKAYLTEWAQYQAGAQRNSRMMAYLDRHWCMREIDEGKTNVFRIPDLHMHIWEEVVLDETQDIVREAALQLVRRGREGKEVDEGLVKEVVEAHCVDENDTTKRVPDVYQLLLSAKEGESDKHILSRAVHLAFHPTASLLLSLPTSPEIPDPTSRTLLSHAASLGHTSIVQLLLDSGANIDSEDQDGRTPLSWAAGMPRTQVIRILLEKGADPYSEDKEGRSPLWWAQNALKSGSRELAVQMIRDKRESMGEHGRD